MTQTLHGRRGAAERRMRDVCTITRVTSVTTDADGDTTPTTTVVYGPDLPKAGRCRVVAPDPRPGAAESAGAAFTVQRYRVDVPVAATVLEYRPRAGDVIEVVSAAADPHLTGRRFRVVATTHPTVATAYRIQVQEVTPDA